MTCMRNCHSFGYVTTEEKPSIAEDVPKATKLQVEAGLRKTGVLMGHIGDAD